MMQHMGLPRLYIIIPCYNEEAVLPVTAPLFLDKLSSLIQSEKINENSRILFVNDGSEDGTWEIIKQLSCKEEHYIGISQSRNRGHQNALLAGLMEVNENADITISIDCDGQDDMNAMDEMIDAYLAGADIVYGVRNKRKTDTFFKRFTAESYYKVLHWMGAEIVYNHADYRLVSKRVLESFADFEEVNLFLRGVFPLVGYKSTCVYYERTERMLGETHYSLKKMIGLAIDGITSLTTRPLSLIMGLGVSVSILSFTGVIWAIISRLIGNTVSGWTSMFCLICFMGGIQLICIGVIGQYVGKIYMEVKHRPRYIISERTWDEKKSR